MVSSRSACVERPDTKPVAATRSANSGPDRSKPPSPSTLRHSSTTSGGIAPDQVEDVALEVGCLGDVHRRAGGLLHLGARAHAVAAGAEELVQHVVLVGGEDQLVDRQAHLPRDVAGEDVAEVAGGHGEGHRLADLLRHGEIALEVVHHLRHDARPVDRVDRADAIARLERRIVADRLDDVLAVVEHAAHGDVEDVRVLQRVHLRRLERAHLAVRREHEHAHAALAAHGVLGRRTGVARGRTEDVELRSGPRQHVLEQIAEELHRQVLEGQRRPVGQCQQVQARLQRLDRRDVLAAEHRGRVGPLQQRLEVRLGNVVRVAADDLERQLRVGQLPPAASSSPEMRG